MSTTVDQGNEPVAGEEHTELKRVMGPKLLLLFIVGDILGTGVYALTGEVASRGRRRRVGAVPRRLRHRDHHRVQLPRARDEVPAGGRRGAVHAQGVRHPLRDLHRLLHGDVLRASRRRRPPRTRSRRTSPTASGSTATTATSSSSSRWASWPSWRRSTSAGSGESSRPTSCSPASSSRVCCSSSSSASTRCSRARPTSAAPWSSTARATRAPSSPITAATSLAFFAMVGFEDSVNMAEETKDPVRNFPKMMLTGLGITGVIYVLVAIFAVAIVPVGELGEQRHAARHRRRGRGARLPDRQAAARSSRCSPSPTRR